MKKKRPLMLKLLRETPEARKARVTLGKKFRTVVFASKKRRLLKWIAEGEDGG
jgi:hypothetical protein